FIAQIDSKGYVYVDLYNEGNKREQVKQKPLLAAQLRKIQADMEGFAIQTDDQTAKQMYYSQSKELQNLIDIINPYLKERSEEHTSELQSRFDLVCRLLLEKKNTTAQQIAIRDKRS